MNYEADVAGKPEDPKNKKPRYKKRIGSRLDTLAQTVLSFSYKVKNNQGVNMATFTEYPGEMVYTDAAGHQRIVTPTRSNFDGSWYYIYSTAPCTDECPVCNSDEQDDYCGEVWDEY